MRTLEDEDLLVFGSIGERGRKPVKDVTREILVIGDQTWPEPSSLGNGALKEVRLQRYRRIIHVKAVFPRKRRIGRETGQHLYTREGKVRKGIKKRKRGG